jgi:flagellar basal-body rod modification protein FlgD
METNPISGSNTTNSGVLKKSSVSQENFLNLLVAQLKNQDPTAPLKNEELLSQLAQFSQLETTQAMSATQTQSTNLQAAALVGRSAVALTSDGKTVSGVIGSVLLGSAGPMLDIGGQQVTLDELQGVGK